MKKLFTVTLLAGLLSIPSVVFAEATWYGSIRTGIESAPHNAGTVAAPDYNGSSTGVADFASRWGIKGSSEVSEGLTAVYRYERKIRSNDAEDTGGRLSYVGLSGGFGTLTVGQVWGAAYNHFGGIVDQGLNYSSPGMTGYRVGNALSYAVSVGSVSLQADAIMDQGTKKTGDAFNLGATMGVGESGSVAFAHRKHADAKSVITPTSTTAKKTVSSSFVAGSYGIGAMTVFLGYSQDSKKDTGCISGLDNTGAAGCWSKRKIKTTYAGVHGGVGDTGVNYVFTMRTVKDSSSGWGQDTGTTDDVQSNTASSTSSKNTPWTFGLSRSLGGGATVKFEHSEPDSKQNPNVPTTGGSGRNTAPGASTAVWLQVDF